MDDSAEKVTEMTQPIIIDLGKQKSKAIKDLKTGQGKLWEEVLDVIEEAKSGLGDEASGKAFIPVVMIYRRKRKRQRMNKLLFPLAR
jgi:hypothetical protein